MTRSAKYNIQRGVSEDKRHEWTNYTIDNPLDAYILYRKIFNNRMDMEYFINNTDV